MKYAYVVMQKDSLRAAFLSPQDAEEFRRLRGDRVVAVPILEGIRWLSLSVSRYDGYLSDWPSLYAYVLFDGPVAIQCVTYEQGRWTTEGEFFGSKDVSEAMGMAEQLAAERYLWKS